MSDITATLKRSIMLEEKRREVRLALRSLDLALGLVDSFFVGDVTPHRQALRNLKLWCAPGSQLEREIMGTLVLAGYRLELGDLEGEGGAA